MYRIVVGDETIWTPTLENNNYLITDPTLTLESNKPSTLDFTVPNISVKKDLISLIRPEIKVYDNDRRIFRGRVLTNGKDFKRNRSIYCEGELAYLRDVIVRPDWTKNKKTVAKYFEDMIEHYNTIMNAKSPYKVFEYGGCDVGTEEDAIVRENDQYPDMLSELTDKLLNKYGGYFVITVGENETTRISYLKDPGFDDSVTIQYGKNLLDLTESEDATPVYTRIIPLGGQENNKRITIVSSNHPTDYLEAGAEKIQTYGLIEHVETYDQIKDRDELEDAGQDTLDHVAVSDSLEITALNSRMPDGSYGVLTCGKTYRILSAPHDYVDEDSRGRLNRQELKLNKPLESRYTFGKVKTGITQEAVSTNRAVDQVVKLAQMTSADVTQLKQDVEALKTSYVAETGFVNNLWIYRKWVIRQWDSSTSTWLYNYLWEYFSYGAIAGWTWTEVSTGRWQGTAEISLPQTMVAYTVIVTPSGLVPLAISAQQQTDKIILHAETTETTQPASTNVNIIVYYLDLS